MATKNEMETFLRTIQAADEEQCNQLRNAIQNRMDLIGQGRMQSLSVGDKVTWTGRRGTKLTGVVAKFNRTTIICRVDKSNETWKCHPAHVHPVDKAKEKQEKKEKVQDKKREAREHAEENSSRWDAILD